MTQETLNAALKAPKPERFDIEPAGSRLGLDMGLAMYGRDYGRISIGLYYEAFDATRALTVDEARAVRDWLNDAIEHAEAGKAA